MIHSLYAFARISFSFQIEPIFVVFEEREKHIYLLNKTLLFQKNFAHVRWRDHREFVQYLKFTSNCATIYNTLKKIKLFHYSLLIYVFYSETNCFFSSIFSIKFFIFWTTYFERIVCNILRKFLLKYT